MSTYTYVTNILWYKPVSTIYYCCLLMLLLLVPLSMNNPSPSPSPSSTNLNKQDRSIIGCVFCRALLFRFVVVLSCQLSVWHIINISYSKLLCYCLVPPPMIEQSLCGGCSILGGGTVGFWWCILS